MARTLIGLKIRDRRKVLGITQAGLAAKLGISASYLNLIEGNRRNIAGGLLKRVADELQWPIDEFDGAAERRLVDDLGEIAVEPVVGALGLQLSSAPDLASQHPAWAHALVTLHRAWLERSRTVQALSDRLNQDPFLGDAVRGILTRLASIRSASEILESVADLDARRRQRFVSIIAGDSRRLSGLAQELAVFFDQAHTASRPITPVEEVDDFLVAHDNHFPALEAAADALRSATALDADPGERALVEYLRQVHAVRVVTRATRDVDLAGVRNLALFDRPSMTLQLLDVAAPATRRFQIARLACELACVDAVAAAIEPATSLGSPAARQRAERALSSYLAGALLLPYGAFLEAAVAARCDIDVLCRRFGASFEQVCHRFVTLRRPGAEGIRMGFMRVDPAGRVTKRFPLPRLPLQRYGSACPLWAVYEAFRSPGTTVRQLAEFPGGERFLLLARTVEQERSDFRLPRRFRSVMLACDALHADRMVYGDGLDLRSTAPATPVGPSCRVCPRRDCLYREEAPIIGAAVEA